jgi:hypothetical protein
MTLRTLTRITTLAALTAAARLITYRWSYEAVPSVPQRGAGQGAVEQVRTPLTCEMAHRTRRGRGAEGVPAVPTSDTSHASDTRR